MAAPKLVKQIVITHPKRLPVKQILGNDNRFDLTFNVTNLEYKNSDYAIILSDIKHFFEQVLIGKIQDTLNYPLTIRVTFSDIPYLGQGGPGVMAEGDGSMDVGLLNRSIGSLDINTTEHVTTIKNSNENVAASIMFDIKRYSLSANNEIKNEFFYTAMHEMFHCFGYGAMWCTDFRIIKAEIPIMGTVQYTLPEVGRLNSLSWTALKTALGLIYGTINVPQELFQTNLVGEGNTDNPKYTGPKALAEYKEFLGNLGISSIPIENSTTYPAQNILPPDTDVTVAGGSALSHWKKANELVDELMTGWSPQSWIGKFTLKALEDIGYETTTLPIENHELAHYNTWEEEYGKKAFEPECLVLSPGNDETCLNFCWYGPNNGTMGAVKLFDQKKNYIKTVACRSDKSASAGKMYHKADVTDLEPGTKYYYSVSNEGNVFSKQYSYTTPHSASARFVIVGDVQMNTGNKPLDPNSQWLPEPNTERQGLVEFLERMGKSRTNLMIAMGDMVDGLNGGNLGDENQYTEYFANKWFKHIPFAPCMGNHDKDWHFTYHYNLANETDKGSDLEYRANYFYRINNVLFIVFNDVTYSESVVKNMINNMKTTFTSAKAMHKGKYDWIIVYHHKTSTSIAAHSGSDEARWKEENDYYKVMTDNDVNMVFTGHDHIFTRSYKIRQDVPKTNIKRCEGKESGTYYITMNSANGSKYYPPFQNYYSWNDRFPLLNDLRRGTMYMSENNLPYAVEKWNQDYKPKLATLDASKKSLILEVKTFDNELVDKLTILAP